MANSFCVVCGRGSTRSSWNNSITVNSVTYVACDFHSQDEFVAAVGLATQGSITPDANVVNQDTGSDESPQD